MGTELKSKKDYILKGDQEEEVGGEKIATHGKKSIRDSVGAGKCSAHGGKQTRGAEGKMAS